MKSYTCLEKPNTENLDKIIKAKKLNKSQLTQLIQYKNELEEDGVHHTIFKKKHEVGRLTPNGVKAVQGFKRDVRKALMNDKYIDIDMANAHPTILQKKFQDHNLLHTNLSEYNANREELLEDMISYMDKTLNNLHANTKKNKTIKKEYAIYSLSQKRDLAKSQFLKVMYGGDAKVLSFELKNGDKTFVNWNATQFLRDIEREFKENATDLFNLPQYVDYIKKHANKDKRNNVLGSALSVFAQEEESNCLDTIVRVFQKAGYTTSTLIHDGLLIEKPPNTSDLEPITDGCKVLKSCEDEILKHNGYVIKVITKPLDDFDRSILCEEEDTDEMEDEIDHDNHTEIAENFITELEEAGHKFLRFENTIYWFNPEKGYYEEDDLREIRPFMKNSKCIPKKTTKFQTDIITQMKSIIKEDTMFGYKIADTTYKKIPFSNGVYCHDLKKLIPYDSSMCFLRRGTIDLPETITPEIRKNMDEVKDKLFLQVYENEAVAVFMLQEASRGLAGCAGYEDKRIMIVVGRPNSSKSAMTEMVNNTFSSFCGIYSSSALCKKRKDGDSALEKNWMLKLKHARLCFANELPSEGLDGNMLKSVVSGGEPHEARMLHGKHNSKFKFQGQLWLNGNEMPNIHPHDDGVKDRVVIVNTHYQFVKQDKYDAIKASGNVPDYIKLADEKIKSVWMKRKEIQQAFALLLIENFVDTEPKLPKEVAETTEAYAEDDTDDARIRKTYIQTKNPQDRLLDTELRERLLHMKPAVDIKAKTLRDKLKDWEGKKWERSTKGRDHFYFLEGYKLVEDTQFGIGACQFPTEY